MKKLCFVALIVASYCSSLAQNRVPLEELRAKADHLMNTHIRGVEQLRPEGWTIEVKPVAMERGPQDTVISQVHIFIKGPPADTLFEQQTMAVGTDKTTTEMQGISVGKDGILICAGRLPTQCGDAQHPDDPIEFTAQSLKGEPNRYLFVSDAGTIGLVVVPYPVGNRDKGCTLSAVRLTPYFELALLTAVGFPPNSDVHYTSTPHEPNAADGDQVVRSDSNGVARFAFIPYARPGQKSGSVKVKILDPKCSPEVSYDWGKP